MSEVVHIASQAVQVGAEIRQRCVWCGYSLIEVDLRLVAVPAEQAAAPFPEWPGGKLIGVDGHATYLIDHPDGDKVPRTFCGAPDDLSSLDES